MKAPKQALVQLQLITPGNYALQGELSFDSVPFLYQQTKTLLNGNAITLDLSGVTNSDSAGVALLLVWLKNAKKAGRQLSFINWSSQMKAIIHLCGLTFL